MIPTWWHFNLFLKKLNITEKAKTKSMQLCDRHQLLEYNCRIPWVDINGDNQVMEETVVAPVNPFPSDVLSARKRKELLNDNRAAPQKKLKRCM